MYNRYTPQPDGSYRRSPAPDGPRPSPPGSPPLGPEAAFPPAPPPPPEGSLGLGSFFRRLLPAGFDTEDLLVVLLLLLMSPDQEEDRSWAMLTLALYLFL